MRIFQARELVTVHVLYQSNSLLRCPCESSPPLSIVPFKTLSYRPGNSVQTTMAVK